MASSTSNTVIDTTNKITRASYVMGVHRWVAASFGLLNVGHHKFVDISLDQQDPTNILLQSMGITLLAISAIIHSAISFSPTERMSVCQCLVLTFAVEGFICLRELITPTLRSVAGIVVVDDRLVVITLLGIFAVICAAYSWASLDFFPASIPTTPQSRWTSLSVLIALNAVISISIGMLSVFYPEETFYEYPKMMDPRLNTLAPNAKELIVIRCWGGFILGIGAMCTKVPWFDPKHQTIFGIIMLFQYIALTVLYASDWDQLNTIYQYGSIPVFGTYILLYVAALTTSGVAIQKRNDKED
mmetsp:Transcript_27522/g.32557  ORF Transcript_27522/g.32557 Transcript_27522/m.32557 type:complete len:301 (+) Transcript_27522:160-1062(+)